MPIRRVERQSYSGEVYNLETVDHSYVTAAGCVHNCDNIGYADLSDFFYVWMRRSLHDVYPNIFGTILVPKTQELVATPYRFNGSRSEAIKFFEDGLHKVFQLLRKGHQELYPTTIY